MGITGTYIEIGPTSELRKMDPGSEIRAQQVRLQLSSADSPPPHKDSAITLEGIIAFTDYANELLWTRFQTAGQGFEPRLRGPEPRVLPLDDPATGSESLAILPSQTSQEESSE